LITHITTCVLKRIAEIGSVNVMIDHNAVVESLLDDIDAQIEAIMEYCADNEMDPYKMRLTDGSWVFPQLLHTKALAVSALVGLRQLEAIPTSTVTRIYTSR
jgi:hypothetical protein